MIPFPVLVTGGCEFIGTNLIHELLRRNTDGSIYVLDNLCLGSTDELVEQNGFELISGDFPDASRTARRLFVGDIINRTDVRRSLAGVRAVVHLAASTGVIPSIKDPGQSFRTNVVEMFCTNPVRIKSVA